jgi:hypothetical protein
MVGTEVITGWACLQIRRTSIGNVVALQNATIAFGRCRRPRDPTFARGTIRSLLEYLELADNARHLTTRRAHPAFKPFFTSLIPEAEIK